MADIAALGIKIDSSGAVVASKNLDNLSQSSAKAEKSTSNLSGRTEKGSSALSGLSKRAGQAGIQIQQFAGQVQGGQSAMLAFSQQAADLGFVLGAPLLGAVAGLSATFISTLVPSLFQADEGIDTLRESIEDLEGKLRTAGSGTSFFSEELQKLYEISRSAAELEIIISSQNAEDEVVKASNRVISTLNEQFGGRNIRWSSIYTDVAQDIADEFGIAREEVVALSEAVPVGGAGTKQDYENLISLASDLASKYGQGSRQVRDLSEALSESSVLAIQAANARDRLNEASEDIGSGGTDSLSGSEDSENVIKSLQNQFATEEELYQRRRQLVIDNTAEESRIRSDLLARIDAEYQSSIDRQIEQENRKTERLEEQLQSRIDAETKRIEAFEEAARREEQADRDRVERVRESLFTETEAIRAEYEKRREIILESTTATEEEKTEILAGLQADRDQKLLDLERERTQAQLEMGEKTFGALAGIAQAYAGEQSGIYRGLLATQKAFTLASVILSSTDAIAKAWAQPFPGNIAAVAAVTAETGVLQAAAQAVAPSFDGGGYTGNASRTGGLDGKGGFMAMMHPQETIVDHTKGQGMAPVINIHNYSGSNVETRQNGNQIDVIVGRVRGEISSDIRRGTGVARDMQDTYGLKRAGTV